MNWNRMWRGISCIVFIPLARQPPVGQGLLILEVSRSHTTTHHIRYDSSRRVISSSQRPLPDNTQHKRQTSMPSVGFEPTISAGERPQIYALDRAATGTGICITEICINKYILGRYMSFVGRDSAVGIKTHYELDGSEIEPRWVRDFPPSSRPTKGPT